MITQRQCFQGAEWERMQPGCPARECERHASAPGVPASGCSPPQTCRCQEHCHSGGSLRAPTHSAPRGQQQDGTQSAYKRFPTGNKFQLECSQLRNCIGGNQWQEGPGPWRDKKRGARSLGVPGPVGPVGPIDISKAPKPIL